MISAKIVADSISAGGHRITTFELEYPRFIHAEFMTHRMFSRNAASSRAIPVKKAIELVQTNTARPKHWGKNQPGMSAKEECHTNIVVQGVGFMAYGRAAWWDLARDAAIYYAEEFDKAGYHKQIVNRLLEPFTHIKVVMTATELDNFMWLRDHSDAQPEIQELAIQMKDALEKSDPKFLNPKDWHTPYYKDGYWSEDVAYEDDPSEMISWRDSNGYLTNPPARDKDGVTLEDALAISASCCAQVSYRLADDTLEKAKIIYKRLVESKPVHASPFEHQATPMEEDKEYWAVGVTHMDRYNNFWSGNFCGWIQHRQLIPGHNYEAQ